jgi:hypothetical protein
MDIKKISSTVITLLLIAAAVYIFSKHKNEQGFWYGVLALALLGSYVKWNSNKFSVKTGAPVDETADV